MTKTPQENDDDDNDLAPLLLARSDQFSAQLREWFDTLKDYEQIAFMSRLLEMVKSKSYSEFRCAPDSVIKFVLDLAAGKMFELAATRAQSEDGD